LDLSLTLWENVNDGILTTAGAPVSLERVQVDSSGMIFVPYAGLIRAAGNSTEALRRIITDKLSDQTPDPQVMVLRTAGDGATVTVTGNIGGQGIYPIERPTRRLSGMIAAAGGVSIEPEIALITVIRGSERGRIWLSQMNDDTSLDIALRPGDRIVVEADTRAFTALGATGSQTRVQFGTQTVSAMEALAQLGGLRTSLADPTGIFILRNETDAVANMVTARHDLTGPQRVVYILNLTEPGGLFNAKDFEIRDEDTFYVTEAPFVQWNKAVSALLGSLGSLESISNFDPGT
jgi:polysaccharide export outer membrane protein